LKYFHHVLRGKAKRFYAKEIQGRSFSFHEAALRIREEYNSVSRQKRIANKLRSLRISQFLVDGSNPCDALEELHETISRLAPQGPMHLRAEMNAKEYLRNAIIGYSWAKGPLNRDSAEDLSYQELYSQLQAAIQQEIEEKAAVLLDQSIGRSAPALPRTNGLPSRSSGSIPGVLFTSPAKYGRDNSRRSGGSTTGITANIGERSCWNCGATDHLLTDCRKPRNLAEIAARKVQFYDRKKFKDEKKALKRVLLEFCEEFQHSKQDETDDDECYDNPQVFFSDFANDLHDLSDQEDGNDAGIADQLFTRAHAARDHLAKNPSLTNCLGDF